VSSRGALGRLIRPLCCCRTIAAEVTDDGKFLLLTPSKGCDPVNMLFVAEVGGAAWTEWMRESTAAMAKAHAEQGRGALYAGEGPALAVHEVISDFSAEYSYLSNNDRVFWFKTNLDAPRGRVITMELPADDAGAEEWLAAGKSFAEAIPECPTGSGEVLEAACYCGGEFDDPTACPRMLAKYLQNVVSVLRVYNPLDMAAGFVEVTMPGFGSASHTMTSRKQRELYFGFESMVHAGSVYHVDLRAPLDAPLVPTAVVHTHVPGYDPAEYVSEQVFVTSKDGTKLPLFLCHHRRVSFPAKTILYGYGGFSISLGPMFSAARTVWMCELGGVYALASIRGGGEYGEEWHKAGSLHNKQNCFDGESAAPSVA
jgi:prolyl oligopeptidase